MGASGSGRKPMPTIWRIPDDLWLIVRTVLRPRSCAGRGTPWIESRRVLDGVLYVLRTGCQWKAVPAEYGSGRRCTAIPAWVARGCWEAMWRLLLQYYDAAESLEWTWQSADASLHKGRWAGKKTGPNPTDRAKTGTKRHILTDGGACRSRWLSRPPTRLTRPRWRSCSTPASSARRRTLSSISVSIRATTMPTSTKRCGVGGTWAHPRRGEERRRCRRGERARRWVVERTHSWFNRCRKLLIRWEKKPQNYLALLQFAATLVVFRLVG